MNDRVAPPPGSPEELAAWQALQARVPELYRRLTCEPDAPQTVVVVPSLSLDPRELKKIQGFWHYEERMLVNLMLLRQPRTKVVFVSSTAIDRAIVDYYLGLLPGMPAFHARKRLVLVHCDDPGPSSLTEKILARPRLMRRLRSEVDDPEAAHVVCFVSSPWERTLAVRLGIPLHSVDPALADLGSKSGCREVFREAGVPFPPGFERLRTLDDVAGALAALKRADRWLKRAAVKLDHGFSGEGNAVFTYEPGDAALREEALAAAIRGRLPDALRCEAEAETPAAFLDKFREMQGVVEAWLEGVTASPSVQCRVNAVGLPQVISSHDQVLGGPTGQVFQACRFPASDAYRAELQGHAAQVAAVLADRGVIGRFGIDFVSAPTPKGWRHHAIEINLRKGGTTHPFLTLKFLTDGSYDPEDGRFRTASGAERAYFASDTVQSDRYVGLRPEDVIGLAADHGLHWHAGRQRGVVFHLLGALRPFGKLGLVAIGEDAADADALYRRMVAVLDAETGG